MVHICKHELFYLLIFKEEFMKIERSAGILLHPTSLPGNFGIGDLGPNAYHFIDFFSSFRPNIVADISARSKPVTAIHPTNAFQHLQATRY